MRNAAETREKLLDTAIRLIWHSSYHKVGVNEICKQAGVTKGAFYHHFESKADLFYAAGHNYWQNSKADIDAIYDPKYTPVEQLHNLINLILDRQANDPLARDELQVTGCPLFTAGSQVGPEEQKVRQCSQELSIDVVKHLSTMVGGLQDGGYLESSAPAEQLARMIHQYVQGLLMYGQVFQDRSVVETDLSEAIYRLVNLKPEYRLISLNAAAE